uniref:AP-4 complex subunit epsilon-1-like isoform X2 n=1 Tax=Crassostrea virginica TaxID=6565 RepID=A0A8B8BYT1_CRAVI|nr:AP-4 complex subunit epsilon-1-like isoform X2 [Crassostrea virginica]
MSDIIEKTFASLPKLFSDGLRGSPREKNSPPRKIILGRGFQSFLTNVNLCRSREEEKTVVAHELKQIKESLNRTDVSQETVCELLCRLVYCHLIGYDVSSGFIHMIKLAQQGTGLEKRIGYLASVLLLHPDHELLLLLMNTIQKDLQSTNILDNCVALSAVCHLVHSDAGLISMMLPLVQKKLQHPRELVRMKAACCIRRFIRIAPSYQGHLQDNIRKLLYDKDPGVMSIGVQIHLQLLKSGVQTVDTLTSDLCSILQQIMNGSLPSSFEYHGIPLPWLQIDILRVLAILGQGNKQNSESMYPLLRDFLVKINMRQQMAYALMYECIVTITKIVPHRGLLKEASVRVKKFVTSTAYVLKYIGVKALTALIEVSPESITDCQMTVVELLDDPDQAIQSKTVDLLYSMANETNVKVVCSKLIERLDNPAGNSSKSELIDRILTLTEKYSGDAVWGYDVVLLILREERGSLPAGLVDRVFSHLTKYLKLPTDKTPASDVVQNIVKKSVQGMFQENCCKELVKIASWILSECSFLLKNMPDDKLMSLLQRQFLRRSLDTPTRLWILSCATSLLCGGVVKPGTLKEALKAMRDALTASPTKAPDFTLQQRLAECERLCGSPLTFDLNTLQLNPHQCDFTLSFLDDFVCADLEGDSKPYMHRNWRIPAVKDPLFSGFGVKPGSESITSDSSEKLTKSASSEPKNVNLRLEGVSRVWGEEGFLLAGPGETHDTQAPEKQRELEKKRELAAALFSGIHGNNKFDEQGELEDPWSQEVPLALDSTSLDWRSFDVKVVPRLDNSAEDPPSGNMDSPSRLVDLSELEKPNVSVFTHDTVVSVDEHETGCPPQDHQSDQLDHQSAHPQCMMGQGTGGTHGLEYHSREPPPLGPNDFSQDEGQQAGNEWTSLYEGVDSSGQTPQDNSSENIHILESGAYDITGSDTGEESLYSQFTVTSDNEGSAGQTDYSS